MLLSQTFTHRAGIKEGELIRGPDGIKVYIVNDFGYRRHIFNPAIFNMYRHFTWKSVKDVTQDVIEAYKVSDLYRALNDYKIYSLEEVDEVKGNAIKHHLAMTSEKFTEEGYDWNQVFIVNNKERDYYKEGGDLTTRAVTIDYVKVEKDPYGLISRSKLFEFNTR